MPERTVLVAGGTGALGAAVLDAFLDDDWRVVATWIVPDERDRVEQRDGLDLVEADLLEPDGAAGAVSRAANEASAPLRAVVNLVGGFAAGANVDAAPIEEFERMLSLNLRPTYLTTQAALPRLIASGGGAIACISARAAVQPFAGASGYVTAKAAVLAFARAVAVEYGDAGVRCNAILPSVIDTPANRAAQPDADHARWVPPAEIATVIRFLCSDESKPTSGAAIPVYGRA